MAQMTQYSMLEQMQNINAATQRSSTIGLIGHTVSYTQADGSTIEGTVDQVTTVGGKLALTVGGKGGIDPETVIEVR
jgi:flagellar basal-body rod modification protein FlgD